VCVCLSVCLSASISPELQSNRREFLCMFPVTVARSSSGGVAIRRVLPVVTTSCLHIVARNKRHERA